MSKRYVYKVERICEWCGKTFETQKRGKATARYCGHSCASNHLNQQPGYKEKLSQAQQKPLITKLCAQCGTEFSFRSMGEKQNSKRRFCGNQCAAQWRMAQPGRREQAKAAIKVAHSRKKGAKDPVMTSRMKRHNPMHRPEVAQRAGQSKRGRTRLARGGNGQVTVPQQTLLDTLGWPAEYLEYAIPTASVKGQFPSLPTCYKVDLAHPDSKTAIEVDGRTHKRRRRKFLAKRRTAVLVSLGWTVLRFWNEEVMENPETQAEKIMSTTSK